MNKSERIRFYYSVIDERAGDRELPLLSVSARRGVVRRDSLVEGPARAEDLSGYRVCQPGDIALNRMSAYQGAVGRSSDIGIVSPDYIVLRPSREVESRYLHYLFRSQWFVGEMSSRLRGIGSSDNGGVRTPRKNSNDLGNISVPLPNLAEQRRIADFLDAETARIDALTEARFIQTSVLGELELARIGAHLSGADLSGKHIQTGWPWLPSIPEEWAISPVYAYFDVQLGKMLNAERTSGSDQQLYLRNANVHWYEINTQDMATMTFEPSERFRYSVQAGDLLVCEGGAGVAEAAVWDDRSSTCFYQKSLHRVRAKGRVPVEWLMYWLRFAKAAGVFDADGNIATIPHLTRERLTEYRIPIPGDGHSRIAELRSEIAAIRRAQQVMATANAMLAERHQALITAAVTGQLDVTAAGGLVAAGGAA